LGSFVFLHKKFFDLSIYIRYVCKMPREKEARLLALIFLTRTIKNEVNDAVCVSRVVEYTP